MRKNAHRIPPSLSDPVCASPTAGIFETRIFSKKVDLVRFGGKMWGSKSVG